MAILAQQSEATAALRRMYFHCVDAADGLAAEVGEAGGQPQFSVNGGAWGNSTNVLVAIGNGRYYVEPTALELGTLGTLEGRYKSAATAESIGTTLQVVAWDPYLATQPVNMTQIGGDSVAGNAATLTLKQLDIQNNGGDALICHSTGGGGDGASFLGEAGGHGILSTGGGTNGDGMKLVGGATNSHGLETTGAGTGSGITTTGGATGHGVHSLGGGTSGDGIKSEAQLEGDGIYALAKGTDEHGILAVGGDTSGNGIHAKAATDGVGISGTGVGDRDGILATGSGTGDGLACIAGATGSGLECSATDGDGIKSTGATNGSGMKLTGAGTGEGITLAGADTGKGGSINMALNTTLAVRTSETIFTLNAGSGTNAYTNMVCAVYDVSGKDWECRKINSYVGASKTITVNAAYTFVVAANDLVRIFQNAYNLSGTGATAAQVWALDVSGNVTQGQAGNYQTKIGGGRYG